jgi:hypothetical protein
VAQLNSASDYGSEGCRFESCRGHLRIKRKLASLGCQFFYACFRRKLACARIKGIKKGAAKQRLFFLDLDYGAQRKTRDEVEGNPQYIISRTIIVQTTPHKKAKKANPNKPSFCNNQ